MLFVKVYFLESLGIHIILLRNSIDMLFPNFNLNCQFTPSLTFCYIFIHKDPLSNKITGFILYVWFCNPQSGRLSCAHPVVDLTCQHEAIQRISNRLPKFRAGVANFFLLIVIPPKQRLGELQLHLLQFQEPSFSLFFALWCYWLWGLHQQHFVSSKGKFSRDIFLWKQIDIRACESLLYRNIP